MHIYLARNCRTNYDDLGLWNDDPSVDVHLTMHGIEQAKELSGAVKYTPLDAIFASEQPRSQHTATIVAQAHSLEVVVEPLLNDHRSGFEGLPTSELLQALEHTPNRWTARLNNGESIEDMKARVAQFLDTLKTSNHEYVLIVSSEWVIRAALATLKGLSNEDAWTTTLDQGDFIEVVM